MAQLGDRSKRRRWDRPASGRRRRTSGGNRHADLDTAADDGAGLRRAAGTAGKPEQTRVPAPRSTSRTGCILSPDPCYVETDAGCLLLDDCWPFLPPLPLPTSRSPASRKSLARERAAAIRDLRYELSPSPFPPTGAEPVPGRVVAAVHAQQRRSRIVLDFAQPRERVRAVTVGGQSSQRHRSTTDTSSCRRQRRAPARNEIAIEFVAGDEALNRNDDFLYTLFVPARAQLAFPCFDQPDLKARYTLTLRVPDGWQAVANGGEAPPREMVRAGSRGLGRHGPLRRDRAAADLPVRLRRREVLGRDGDAERPRASACSTARPTPARSRATARRSSTCTPRRSPGSRTTRPIPYPFGKFDFVLIPSFQFGGMEHAGAILYNASS